MTQATENSEGEGQGGEGAGAGEGQGGAPPAWYAGLPDDVRANPNVTRYASPEDAARALIHYNGHYGVPENQLLRLPKPDDAEGMAAVWSKFGRPETPDKYDAKLPEGSPLDEAAAGSFLAHMHKAGPMTNDMAKEAMNWYANYAKQVGEEGTAAVLAERQASEASLKQEWGSAYDQKFQGACAAALKFGGQALADELTKTGAGDSPATMKAWAAVADAMAEAGVPPGERGRDGGRGLTPNEANAELAKMEGDPKIMAALQNANDPQSKFWNEKRLALIAQANAARV